ncbi:MAG: tRNA (adenosine(37)-N6)-threonylcarbamoyltransferase complex dimerization subunit type 1 TsaB [Chryseolinea sp.]
MAILLSLETSSRVCSVALHIEDRILAISEIHQDQVHASKLAGLIEQIVKTSGIDLHQVSAVAISSGPGSYTGLRIGTSTAKGLCYALNIPLIAVTSLEVMAARVNSFNLSRYTVCPMIDARRMEVYCCMIDAGGRMISPVEAKIIDEVSFQAELESGPILFFGDGSDKCKPVIKHDNAFFVEGVYASAGELGTIAGRSFARNEFVDLTSFEPFYLKEFRIKSTAKAAKLE